LLSRLRHFRSLCLHLVGLCASTFLPPVPRHGFALRACGATVARPLGTMKALTPARVHRTCGSPHFSTRTFLTFHPQPHGVPDHRFGRHGSVIGWFQASPLDEQARRNTPPNRVRFATDRKFASGCFPPRLSATQLPSATGLWPPPVRTLTALIHALMGALVPAKAGTQSKKRGAGFPIFQTRSPPSRGRLLQTFS
jgi:hypothetical protein